MFDNTRYAFDKLKKDLRIISWIFTYGLNVVLIAYYIFALVADKGNLIANIILLCVTVLSIVLSIIYNKIKLTRRTKQGIKKGKRFAKIVSLLTKAYILVCTLYAMYVATSDVNPIEIILATILILLWIISVFAEMASLFVEIEKNRILDGLKKDFEPVLKVKDAITDTVENVKDGIEVAKSKVVGFFNKNDRKKLN